MISATRNQLKRKLDPETFHRLCYYWWIGKFYLPRRVASAVIRRRPIVHGPPSPLVEDLRSINTFAPTRMCRIMTRYSSDKGNSWHNYTTVYTKLFKSIRGSVRAVFELGLGRDHPNMAMTIGKDGLAGASLRGWRAIFPKAEIFGADIDRDVLFQERRIQTFYCDQLSEVAIRELWSQPAIPDLLEVVIEDGLHTFEGNTSFLEGSLQHVRPGGFYAIEDIKSEDLHKWIDCLPSYAKRYPDCEFALLELPNTFNKYDNNMLVIRKGHATV